jgi:hypothetical protein
MIGRYWRIGTVVYQRPKEWPTTKESDVIAMTRSVHVAQRIVEALNEQEAKSGSALARVTRESI